MSSSASRLRNVAFIGHPSSGKTTLVDALAHAMGASDRKGSVADKSSICDTEPEEQEKQHTLSLSAVHATHEDREWTLFDTPGYPDFIAEALGGMFAADLVVGVVSCSSGVTFNLRSKLDRAAALGRGRMIVVTHLDAENADFDQLVQDLRDSVGEICVPVRLPNQSGPGFSELTRVVTDESSPWRRRLMDRIIDACEDEALVESYLETENLTEEQMEEHIPAAIAAGSVIPILPVNPVTGLGVEELIFFLTHYSPCPVTHPSIEAAGEIIIPDPAAPLVGVVFNVKADPHVGKVCLARIVTGTLSASDSVVGTRGVEPKGEKLGGLFRPIGAKREAIEDASAGEIVSFSKVEGLEVGEAFSTVGHDAPEVHFAVAPVPMVSLAVVPKSRADEQKIGAALTKITAEDPTLSVEQVALTHELVLHGMSDLHLQITEARLKRRFGVEIDTHLPRIAYQESITKAVEAHHRHKKQSGGRGQFGECYLRLRPGEKDSGVVFEDKVVGGSIPRNLIPAVEKGVREVAARGVLTTGSSVVDVVVEVYDGKFHAVDSDEASFKVAGGRAFKEGFLKAGPVLLEPVMEVQIHIPSDDAGTIFSDLTSHRRGQVLDQQSEGEGHLTFIKAHVPLSTMQTYHRDLKSQTAGEGTYSMAFDHYGPVPASEQQKVIAELGQRHDED